MQIIQDLKDSLGILDEPLDDEIDRMGIKKPGQGQDMARSGKDSLRQPTAQQQPQQPQGKEEDSELKKFLQLASSLPFLYAYGQAEVATDINDRDILIFRDIYGRPSLTLLLSRETTLDIKTKLEGVEDE